MARRPASTHPATPDPDNPGVCLRCHLPLNAPNRRHGFAYRVRRINEGRSPSARLPEPTLF